MGLGTKSSECVCGVLCCRGSMVSHGCLQTTCPGRHLSQHQSEVPVDFTDGQCSDTERTLITKTTSPQYTMKTYEEPKQNLANLNQGLWHRIPQCVPFPEDTTPSWCNFRGCSVKVEVLVLLAEDGQDGDVNYITLQLCCL